MSLSVSGVGKLSGTVSAAKSWLEDLWDDITGTGEDTSESVQVPAAAAGCGGGGPAENIPDGMILVPDVADADGITIGDGGIVIFEGEYLIDDLGARVQEGDELSVGPVRFSFTAPVNTVVKIIFESVPENFNPALAGLEGMIDVTEVPADAPGAFNIGTEEEPRYIVDPFDINTRIPMHVGTYTMEDLISGSEETLPVCSFEDIYTENYTEGGCRPIGAVPNGYELVIAEPGDENRHVEAAFNLRFNLRYDAAQYMPGHEYDYRLRIRLVVEPRGVESDADAGEVYDGGEDVDYDADVVEYEDGIDTDIPPEPDAIYDSEVGE
jgi:hypothetical protein